MQKIEGRPRGAGVFVVPGPPVEACMVVLLLVPFCLRVWGLGITTTDDAVWALWAHQAGPHPIADFAISQGRFWAIGGGTWLTFGLRYTGTVTGDALIIGSFLLFFFMFTRVVATYWSPRTAYATSGIFLALFVLRADRSILTAYPLFFWIPASAVAGALLAARRYQNGGGILCLAGCGVLAMVGLFNNEGAMLLTLLALPAGIIANHLQAQTRQPDASRARRTKAAFAVVAMIAVLFVAAALAWRLLHPSTYAGNTLAPLDAGRIAWTLFNFTTSGTILYDFFHPYTQTYSDAMASTGAAVTYVPWHFLPSAIANPASLMAGGLMIVLMARTLLPDRIVGRLPATGFRLTAIGCAVGLVIATLPLLPVAMTGQYQDWFYQSDSHAYSHTIFASFGLVLVLGVLLTALADSAVIPAVLRFAIGTALAIALGFLTMLGSQMNDAIARDIRPEAGRWRVLKDLAEIAEATASREDVFLAPRFRSGSWFAVVASPYWTEYARDRYRSPIRLADRAITRQDLQTGADFADYQLNDDGHSFTVTAAHLKDTPATEKLDPIADRIAVLVEPGRDPSLLNRVLTFMDRRRGVQQIKLAALRRIAPRVWAIDGIEAEPASIHVLSQPYAPQLRITCGDTVVSSQRLDFRLAATEAGGCYAGGYLQSGWSSPEASGTWSDGAKATLLLPTGGLPEGDLALAFDVSSYSAMGFHDRPQDVHVSLDGHRMATWRFTPGTPLTAAPLVLPGKDWRSVPRIAVTFEIDPPYRPSALGKGTDTRDLGLFLRSLTLQRARP